MEIRDFCERNQRRRKGRKELGREGAAADERKRGGDARRKEAAVRRGFHRIDERRRRYGEVFIAGRDRARFSSRGVIGAPSRKCVPYYDELCVIFGDDQATGGNAITGNEANIELPSFEEMCNAEKSLPTKEEKNEVNQSSSSATRTGSNGQRTKRKKSSNIDATEQGLTTAANRLSDAFALTDCARLQKELHNIPELSREDVMRAMLLLGGEVKDANLFFHLDEDLKKDWVILYLQRKF
ncbi:hypothetical protein Syun_014912 [Stephania yunnanensis]|uniref:Uncharacterized protein n=1 Tax=Stephania yunnanensis TaxID=152371 RepID=A0AAP0JKD8_9MAGN